jgi:hypothetical protein
MMFFSGRRGTDRSRGKGSGFGDELPVTWERIQGYRRREFDLGLRDVDGGNRCSGLIGGDTGRVFAFGFGGGVVGRKRQGDSSESPFFSIDGLGIRRL